MKDDLTQTDMIKPQIKNDMLKAQAKIAKSINWKVVDNWREKLGAQDNFEMLLDYDFGVYYENRKLIRNSPFQSHVRLNFDKMIFSGCLQKEDVVQYADIDLSEDGEEDESQLCENIRERRLSLIHI